MSKYAKISQNAADHDHEDKKFHRGEGEEEDEEEINYFVNQRKLESEGDIESQPLHNQQNKQEKQHQEQHYEGRETTELTRSQMEIDDGNNNNNRSSSNGKGNDDFEDDLNESIVATSKNKKPSIMKLIRLGFNYNPGDVKKNQRLKIVFAASISAFLGPISTTVYTPSIPTIGHDFNVTDSEVMSTASIYLMISGLMPLIWGPISDKFGRRISLLSASIIFCLTSIASAFTWNIHSLIAFRILQAIGAAACLTVGSASIADSHSPEVRGRAMGYYLLGPLMGPVMGPTIGGVIATYLGWRRY